MLGVPSRGTTVSVGHNPQLLRGNWRAPLIVAPKSPRNGELLGLDRIAEVLLRFALPPENGFRSNGGSKGNMALRVEQPG